MFKNVENISSWRRISTAMWDEHNSPQVIGFDDIDMTQMLEVLEELREKSGEKVTVTHAFVKAMAQVYARFPQLNVLVVRGKVMQRKSIDIFVQVSVPKAAGSADADLSGVKIRNAEQKTVVDVARELRERAEKVRAGEDKDIEDSKRLMDILPGPLLKVLMRGLTRVMFDAEVDLTAIGVKPDPFGSGMVTNCGGFGVHAGFAPLVTLARTPVIFLLGRIEDKPVVRNKQVTTAPLMRVGGTFDHRLLDGYQVGLLSNLIKEFMENPRNYPDWLI